MQNISLLIAKAKAIEASVPLAETQDDRDKTLRAASAAWNAVIRAEDARDNR